MNIHDLDYIRIESVLDAPVSPVVGAIAATFAFLTLAGFLWVICWEALYRGKPKSKRTGVVHHAGAVTSLVGLGGAIVCGILVLVMNYQHTAAEVNDSNQAVVQEWAKDTYGISMGEKEAGLLANKAVQGLHYEKPVTVTGVDGRMMDVYMRVQDDTAYLMGKELERR